MEFTFKTQARPIHSDDFWYDLFSGGYIRPRDYLEDEEQIQMVESSIYIIQNFLDQLEEEGFIEPI